MQNNNLSPSELRFALAYVDILGQEVKDLKYLMRNKLLMRTGTDLKDLSWSHLYELSFAEITEASTLKLGINHDFKFDTSLEYTISKINLNIDNTLDAKYLATENVKKEEFVLRAIASSYILILSVISLLTYGYYINDLVKIARDHKDSKIADNALFNAIRIDPSVVGCPTATNRLSRAIIFSDNLFIKKLKNALSGKIGMRESKNYQKMRFILQILHENGGLNLTDNALNELFVNQLELYSDSQETSEKNISEFTRKFKAQKSTI